MSGQEAKEICGIIMPISAIDGCTEAHWAEVLDILTEAIEDAGFKANLVSNADDSGIIHKRIIQNLYENPIVVCDVSGKNPNVMFELGLRLAFDKPTVIIKDDKTSYAFDTSSIEHVEYPRDLRFSRIVEFKRSLCEKIKATHQRATSDENYTTFLKHFGEFKVAKIEQKEVSGAEYILDELKSLGLAIRRVEANQPQRDTNYKRSQGLRWPPEKSNNTNDLSTPIQDLGLSTQSVLALTSSGVVELRDLIRLSEVEILKIPAAGRNVLNDIKASLDERGLSLRQIASN